MILLMQKSILITGCSSGIGLVTAQFLKNQGYQVFATARKAADLAQLQQLGLEAIECDVNDSASIQMAVKNVLAKTNGELYALINNAGFGMPGALEDLSREQLRTQFETNVFGLQEMTNAVLPTMRKQKEGRIINISSLLGIVSLPFRGAYNASKYAVEGLSDTLRLELAGTGIYVSMIEPGPIESQFRATAIRKAKENLPKSNTVHQTTYDFMLKHFEEVKDDSAFTLPPEAVAKKILKALESKNPKARYPVTFPTYFFAYAKRWLPTCALDWILRKISKAELKK